MAKWIKSEYPGVRYREHPTRRHNKAPDRYYVIRYRYQGRLYEEAVGWASAKWTPKKAAKLLLALQENHKTGTPPVTLAEMRAMEDEKRRLAAEAEALKQELPQTFNQLADIFVKWSKANKKSCSWDEQRLKDYIRPAIGSMELARIETHHIEALRSRLLDKGRSPATIGQVLGLIRRVFNHGLHLFGPRWTEVCPRNPCQGVKLPRLANQRKRYLTTSEAELLLTQAAKNDPLMHDVILTALYTGLRRSEIATLAIWRLDLDQRLIHVLDAKSGQDETVDFPDHLADVLQGRIKGKRPAELVFPARGGGELKSISQRFKKLADDAGLNAQATEDRDKVVFHTLRHTYISWLVIGGTDLRTVQQMARHRSLEMTMRYAHLAPSSTKRAAARLPQPGKVLQFPGQEKESSSG